jgi:hypothetical protein
MDVFDFGSHLEASRGLEAVAEEAPFEAEGTLFEGAGTPFEAEGTSFDAKGAVSEDPLFFLSFLFCSWQVVGSYSALSISRQS